MSTHIKTVELFVAAFNAQDSDAIASLVADDIEWLSIVNNEIVVEARSKNNLIESMDTYFESCPTCRPEFSNRLVRTCITL